MPPKPVKERKFVSTEAPQGATILNKDSKSQSKSDAFVPRSIVARGSKLQGPAKTLVSDLRKFMEPYTAVNLKEKNYNRMKDYVSVAGSLDISHIMTVSQTKSNNVVLKIARHASGPTLHFRVHKYSLAGQVKAIQKKPYDSSRAFQTPPVVVLNNFGQSNENSVNLMKIMFQNMLPTIDVKTVKLGDCRRVALFHYRKEDGQVELRHYAIKATPVGISRSVKKILQGKIPNLGELQDVSEFMEGKGLGAISDSEPEDEDCRVTLADKFVGRGNSQSQQSAMKLVELGPRLTMELFKVENGVGEGEVIYHKFVHKSPEEAKALKHRVEGARQLKEERRNIQEENVKRKREALELKRTEKFERKKAKYEQRQSGVTVGDNEDDDDESDDESDEEIDDHEDDNDDDEGEFEDDDEEEEKE